MKTIHVVHSLNEWCRRHHRLILLGLSVVFLAASSATASPPARPQIAPGGNNYEPGPIPHGPGLSTQALGVGLTPANLVTALLGPGMSVSNVSFSGANTAAGTFAGGTGIVGFDSGIVLSSGDISFVPGPNMQDDVTAVNAGNGDADLNGLVPGFTTYDACVLEFDFTCTGAQVIQFQYTFTSEEYNEWVNTAYNDVFGFFLNGVNIALVPGSAGTPVSINNVNCDNPYNPPGGSFCNLFINNDCSDTPPGTFPCVGARNTQMDGLTVVLTATGTLIPGVNHIKLAVADAGDQVLDSNVFIQGQSFACGAPSGACCNTAALICTNNVLQANCQGANEVWSVGLACSQLNPPCTSVVDPGGTDCASSIPINALPFVDINTTSQKGNNYSSSCLGDYDNGNDIIYKLTLSSTQCITINVVGESPPDNWIGVVLDSACPPGASCIAQATTPDTVATISNLTLAPGIYYLMIDRWPVANDSLSFTLTITACGVTTGACCNTNTHTCASNVPQAACQETDDVWTLGQTCALLNPPCVPTAHPPGYDCEYLIQIDSLPFVDTNTTIDKSDDYSNTCLNQYDNGDDISYSIVLSEPRCLNILVTGSTAVDSRIGMVVSSECPAGDPCIASATTEGTAVTIGNLSLAAGTYYLMIDRRPANGDDFINFTLSVTDCQAATGACCLPDGSCGQITEGACLQAGGLGWTVGESCNPNPCPYLKGDLNCDHAVTAADVQGFVAALIGNYTGCDSTLADMDDSGVADGVDIQAFVNKLLGN